MCWNFSHCAEISDYVRDNSKDAVLLELEVSLNAQYEFDVGLDIDVEA